MEQKEGFGMQLEDILVRFAQLAGLNEDEAAPWENLCRDALAELSANVRPGAVGGEALLNAACAALAFYRYSLVQAAGAESSFTAGDMKITTGTQGVAVAERLWNTARCAAAPYLRDEAFCFRQVRL